MFDYSIKVNGETFKAPPPTLKLFRKYLEFNKKYDEAITSQESIDDILELIIIAVNPDGKNKITFEYLNDNLDLDTYLSAYEGLTKHILGRLQIPKENEEEAKN